MLYDAGIACAVAARMLPPRALPLPVARHTTWLCVLPVAALLSIHCASNDAPESVESGVVHPPSTAVPLSEGEISLDQSPAGPGGYLVGRCVTPELPTDALGIPACVVLTARKLSELPGGSVGACDRCDRPGTRVPNAATLARAKLPTTETGCLCEIVGQAPPVQPAFDGVDGFWYETDHTWADGPSLRVTHCPVGARASLVLSPGVLEPAWITLTFACYAE